MVSKNIFRESVLVIASEWKEQNFQCYLWTMRESLCAYNIFSHIHCYLKVDYFSFLTGNFGQHFLNLAINEKMTLLCDSAEDFLYVRYIQTCKYTCRGKVHTNFNIHHYKKKKKFFIQIIYIDNSFIIKGKDGHNEHLYFLYNGNYFSFSFLL